MKFILLVLLACLSVLSLFGQITQGPGGPILVVASSSNPFGTYYAEILRAEGLNEFFVTDISTVTAAQLATYDVVVLGQMALTAAQVTMFTNYVNGGGNLIAMRPDKQLASLLGITDAASTLTDAYLLINTATAPGAGIVNQTIQFHNTADRYNLSGATAVATLFSNATTATSSPAVTLRTVGSGQAASFAYDLAKSIVYTRQGNPAWAGQPRSAVGPVAVAWDLFYGPSPNWVDITKLHIPQADEQMRLLANMILYMNRTKKPLPRFWYLPFGYKGAVIMTSDDHANGYTTTRYDTLLAASPAGCSVANWGCPRASSFIYTNEPVSNATFLNYQNQGFDTSLHLNVNCSTYTAAIVDNFITTQQAAFKTAFPSLNPPATNRTHCNTWSDYSTQAQEFPKFGIRLDTTFVSGPYNFYNSNPGHMTSSAMPMRFADVNGNMFDVYQAATPVNDMTNEDMVTWANTIMNRAVGAEQYYAFFTVLIHADGTWENPFAAQITQAAQALGIPVISGRQALTWLDGRNNSSFSAISGSLTQLNFTVSAATGSNGIQAMVPASTAAGALTGITRSGSTVSFTTQTIKGNSYALFAATAGSYTASYGSGAPAPPVVLSNSPTGSGISINTTVTANFSTTMNAASFTTSTFTLQASGATGNVPATVTASGSTATLTPSSPLTPSTTYTATISGSVTSSAGVAMGSNYTWTFTTGTNAPTVTSFSPTGTGVAVTTAVSANFSTTMNAASFTTSTFTLLASGSTTNVPASVTASGSTATLTPSSALAAGTTYTATISGSVTSSAGIAMGSDFTWTFTTASPAPTVTSFAPTGTTVATSTTVTATFSTTKNSASFTTSTFTLLASGSTTNVPATVTASGTTATLTPSSALAPGTTYTATILGSVTSAAGVAMGTNFTWTFTTAPTAPVVTSVAPTGSSVSVSTAVTANFSKPMNTASFTTSTFTLRASGASSNVPATVGASGSSATLTPTSALTPGTTYTATVSGTVTDTTGIALGANYAWSFATAPAGGGSGPIGLWTLDEGSGTTAADSSGNGNIASLTGTAWTTGKIGNALSFNGTTSFAQVGNPALLNNLASFTWAFWSKPAGEMGHLTGPAIEKGMASDVRKTFDFGAVGGFSPLQVFAEIKAGTNARSESDFNTYAVGVWTHWAMTYDDLGDRKIHIYKNGVEVVYRTQNAATGTLTPDSDALLVWGATQGTQYYAYNGALDDIRIYNRVLSLSEIGTLAAGTPTPPTVLSNAPQGTAVLLSTNVTANFSTAMNPASFTSSTFRLRASGAASDTSATLSISGSTATLMPVSALTPSTTYTVTISGTVTSSAGLAMGSDFTWSFTTQAPPPTVVSVAPSGTGVATTSVVTATFSTTMNPASITTSTFRLRASGATSDVPGTVTASGASATLTPTTALAAGTTFTATISATVTSSVGSPLGTDYVWSFTTAGVAPAPGPVGYWTFNEGTGTVANDSSGNGNNGALTATTWTAGHLGSALAFNGSTSLVTIGNPTVLNNLSRFTWTFWANATGDMGRFLGPVLEKGVDSDTRKTFTFGPLGSSDPSYVYSSVKAATTNAYSEAMPNTYTLNVWTHWAITYDDLGDRTIHIYKNGVEVTYRVQTAAVGAIAADSDATLVMGGTPGTHYYGFTGLLDDVRIHNRILSVAEIQTLAAQ